MIVVVNVRNLNYLSVSPSILPIVALEALQSGVHRNLIKSAAALYISFTLHIFRIQIQVHGQTISDTFCSWCLGKTIFLISGVYLIVIVTNPPPSCSEVGLQSFFFIILYHRYPRGLYQNVQNVGRVCYSTSHCWQCQPWALLNTARGGGGCQDKT